MRKNQLIHITLLTIITSLLLGACNPATPLPTQTPLPTNTPGVQLVDLSQITPVEPEPTKTALSTLAPTATPSASPTKSATPEATTTESIPSCTNQAEFVRHLSISDNTAITASFYFKKIWQIRNVGTCTWTTGYHLVFDSGNQMFGPEFIELPHEVKPQETVDIELILIAPDLPGTYSSTWMLQDENEKLFGIGDDYTQGLVVIIVVPKTTEKSTYDIEDPEAKPSSGGGGGG